MIRVLYAGSPAASALTLELLLQDQKLAGAGCSIVGVLTNPAAARGRHKTPVPTPVEEVARKQNIPVFTPDHLDGELRSQIAPLNADILVCFAYGHIFGPKFLALFRFGGINLHPSLLPRYRGCTPVPAAIRNRDTETGISIQKIVKEMDAGDLLAQEKIPLSGTETAGSLLELSARNGSVLLAGILYETAVQGKLPDGTAQSGVPSYTAMLTKDDGRIDWNKPASEIDALIRACTPDPGCWTTGDGKVLRILGAHVVQDSSCTAAPGAVTGYDKNCGILVGTGSGMLAVTELQWQSKNALNCRNFMNGCRDFIGSVLV